MKKELLYTTLIISLLFLATFVIAAGRTTIPQTDVMKQRIMDAADDNSCEKFSDRKNRIKCRLLVYKQDSYDEDVDYKTRVPEACQASENTDRCTALYKKVWYNKCYDLEAREKAACFKRTLDIKQKRFSDVPDDERKDKARNYVLLLLYELQERIEHGAEEGKISDDDAAEIIDLIVTIKQQILDGETRDTIKENITALKEKIREVRNGE